MTRFFKLYGRYQDSQRKFPQLINHLCTTNEESKGGQSSTECQETTVFHRSHGWRATIVVYKVNLSLFKLMKKKSGAKYLCTHTASSFLSIFSIFSNFFNFRYLLKAQRWSSPYLVACHKDSPATNLKFPCWQKDKQWFRICWSTIFASATAENGSYLLCKVLKKNYGETTICDTRQYYTMFKSLI